MNREEFIHYAVANAISGASLHGDMQQSEIDKYAGNAVKVAVASYKAIQDQIIAEVKAAEQARVEAEAAAAQAAAEEQWAADVQAKAEEEAAALAAAEAKDPEPAPAEPTSKKSKKSSSSE